MSVPYEGDSNTTGTPGLTGTNSGVSFVGGIGVSGKCTSPSGLGVSGVCVAPSALSLPTGLGLGGLPVFRGAGVLGSTNATAVSGVGGLSDSGQGVYGPSSSSSGVYGTSTDFDAVVGETNSNAHAGVTGRNLTTGAAGGVGVYGTGGQYAGKFDGALLVNGAATTGTLTVNGAANVTGVTGTLTALTVNVANMAAGTIAIAAFGGDIGVSAAGNTIGIRAESQTLQGGTGVFGYGTTSPSAPENGGIGVYGFGGAFGVAGLVNNPTAPPPPGPVTVSTEFRGMAGVYGECRASVQGSWSQAGVKGYSTGAGGAGVSGTGGGDSLCGVLAYAQNGIGILAGSGAATNPIAGRFEGGVQITGTLTKSAGGFRIDHPLNPEDQYLQHSFVESPDMMNVYCGTAVLDDGGEAEVKLPDWFEALNREFRYQLTCVGKFVPVFISKEIAHNKFGIAGGAAGIKVCWQVTGVRHDAYAEQHRLAVEIDKDTDVGAAQFYARRPRESSILNRYRDTRNDIEVPAGRH